MLESKIICKRIAWSAAFLAALAFFSCATKGAAPDDGSYFEAGSKEADFSSDFFLPERFEEIPAGQSSATFKTNVPKAALYVNGEYHGLTPLKATGLVPGRYAVQIKREGYKTVNITIQVKDGISDFYYIELETAQEPAAAPIEARDAAPSSQEQRQEGLGL